jgi:mannose-6-phosphate isomerase-like protein (cupin superfamily)
MFDQLAKIGCWPLAGIDARAEKRIRLIKPSERLRVIHGKALHVPIEFAVSNDFIHVAIMDIRAGERTDSETHEGDEVFYVLDGEVSVIIPTGQDTNSVARGRFEVRSGQRFLIPEGTKHIYFNTGDCPCRLIFGVAPKL